MSLHDCYNQITRNGKGAFYVKRIEFQNGYLEGYAPRRFSEGLELTLDSMYIQYLNGATIEKTDKRSKKKRT